MDWLNETFDLAAIASAAGLAGSGGATLLALMFAGKIVKLVIKLIFTAIFTGIGFYFLLGWLGFEIVPKETSTAAISPAGENFAPMSGAPARTASNEDQGDKVIVVKSPFRRGG